MSSRILALVVAGSFCGSTFAANPTPQEQALKQQVEKLQQQVIAAEKQVAALQTQLAKANGSAPADQNTIADLKKQVEKLQADLKKAKEPADDKPFKALQAQLDAVKKAKVVHTLMYTIKGDAAETETQSMLDDVPVMLSSIKSARALWAGKPMTDSSTPDYTLSLVMVFDDADAMKKFLADPQWKKFTEKHEKFFDAPKVYDSQAGK